MAKIVSGVVNGTGAALYVCVGFIPDRVVFRNVEDTTCLVARWSKKSRSAEQIAGVLETQGVSSALSVGGGIAPYRGGDVMTAAIQAVLTFGGVVTYQKLDQKDYRGRDIASGASPIDTWTLADAGNRAGHFNEDVVGTYIGEGSLIVIDGKEYIIESVAGGTGNAGSEVVLNEAAASGVVERIGPMYDMLPIPLGDISPAGFSVKENTLNAQGKICCFEATKFDN